MKTTIDPLAKETIKKWLGTGSINIFGAPFAGKDTQGKLLVKTFDAAPLLGGGDILRNSVIPDHVKKIMEKGAFIPTQDYIDIVLPYLGKPEFSGKPLILSAIGRWHGEEPGVVDVTTRSNHPLKAVIYINLEEKIVWERWHAHKELGNRGVRKDDEEAAALSRYKEFQEKTPPVIDFYRNMGLVIDVNGNQTPEKVFSDIIDQLFLRAEPAT